jgi:ABC-type lipoprotein export system ATPase subunit
MMDYKKGSEWRIWDLHVHTPASLVQHYGPDTDETWERFICDIEALDPRFSVLGINDYIFIDGYKRLLDEKSKGRMSNIDRFLPVVELRLDKFGGTAGALNRVNLHVIFSESVTPEVIRQQFIGALPSRYVLSASARERSIEWGGVITRESLTDFGSRIIESVPSSERPKFGSPLMEGFNNLNVSLEKLESVLCTSYFKDRHMLAVGKTEWSAVKWNSQSIAEKKNIVNRSRIVFTAAETPEQLQKSKSALASAGIDTVLMDCSDAHDFSDTKNKDRIGNCATWVKADPSFRGLMHALIESEGRIFLGDVPPEKAQKERNVARIVQKVSIHPTKRRKDSSNVWFDADIEFNSGLVAIIGYKGSGKSALTDVLGLLGSSRTEAYWSFLCDEKFRKLPENIAGQFEAAANWVGGSSRTAVLSDEVEPEAVSLLKYVPQNYFELACNELPTADESEFDRELKSVIFSHVSPADRRGHPTLEDLVQSRMQAIDRSITHHRGVLAKVNKSIVALERQLLPNHVDALNKELADLKERLSAVRSTKPATVRKPKGSSTAQARVTNAERRVENIRAQIGDTEAAVEANSNAKAKVESILATIESLELTVESTLAELRDSADELSLDLANIVSFKFDRKPLDERIAKLEAERLKLDKSLDKKNEGGLLRKLSKAVSQLEAAQNTLNAPDRKYQTYRNQLKAWTENKREIEGNPNTPGTIQYVRSQIMSVRSVPALLDEEYRKRGSAAKGILAGIGKKKDLLARIYEPVHQFVTTRPQISQEIDLRFGVSVENLGFSEGFLDWIDQGKNGPFKGAKEAKSTLSELVSRFDANDQEDMLRFADTIANLLFHGSEDGSGDQIDTIRQLRKGRAVEALYDYVFGFEYLYPRYNLQLGEKPLRQLSPGERGALLVVFYLMVDQEEDTLVIDQPEHNLDNGTVTKLLVPALKLAKRRRQIVMVTHNPILAVVSDADQVIVANRDQIQDSVTYESGALENPTINARIVDILEGTMKAFDDRSRKYIRSYIARQ